MAIIIRGSVQVRGAQGKLDLSPLRIEAWDDDDFPNQDDFLGSRQLNEDGSFEITEVEGKWKDVEPTAQNRPDVYLRIFYGDTEIPCKAKGEWSKEKNPSILNVIVRINAADVAARQPNGFDPEVKQIFRNIDNRLETIANRPDRTDEVLNRVGWVANDVETRFDGVNRSLETYIAYAPTANEDEASDSGSRTSELERLVNDAQRDILGKRIRTDDVKSIESALDRVFVFEQQQGNRVVRWKRPTYTVETELGGDLTGAQASLYDFVHSTAEDLKKRVEALKPLDEEHRDQDRMEAARVNFLTELEDLVAALNSGLVPRPIRVDGCLNRLGQYIIEIEHEFGFDDPDNVDNVNDERQRTEFTMIRTRLGTIFFAWDEYRQAGENTFGETLRRLEGLLGVVASGVGEVYKAMNRVAFNDRERAAATITLTDGSEMTVAELFGWALTLANVKAPRQLKDGGRRAWPRIRDEAERLRAEIEMVAENNDDVVPAFQHPGVNRAIEELEGYLQDVVDALPAALAAAIP